MISKELLINTFKPDGQIKSSSRKRRQNCSKTVVRPDTLLSYLFIFKPHDVFRYLNMVVLVNQLCHLAVVALYVELEDWPQNHL